MFFLEKIVYQKALNPNNLLFFVNLIYINDKYINLYVVYSDEQILFYRIAEWERTNKYRFKRIIDLALEDKEYDFYLFQHGEESRIEILSINALNEFEKLIPHKIDRHDHGNGVAIGNIIRGSFITDETSKEYNEMRKEVIKSIGTNNISQYIPLILDSVDEWTLNVKRNESINLSYEISKVVFSIITKNIIRYRHW